MGSSNVLTKEKVLVKNEENNDSSFNFNGRETVRANLTLDQTKYDLDQTKYDLAQKISQDILESPFKENPTFNPSNFSSTDDANNDQSFVDTPLSDMDFNNDSEFHEGFIKNKKIIIYSSLSILVLILSIVLLKVLTTPSSEKEITSSNKKEAESLITEEKINDTELTTDNTTSTTTDVTKETPNNTEDNISLALDGVKKYIPDSMNEKLEDLLSVLNSLKSGTTIKKHKKTTKKTVITNPSLQENSNLATSNTNLATGSTLPNNTSNSDNSMSNSNNNSSTNNSTNNSNNTTTTNNTYNTYAGNGNGSLSNNGAPSEGYNSNDGSLNNPNDYSNTNSDTYAEQPEESIYQDTAPKKPRVYGTQQASTTPYTKDLPTSSKTSGTIPDNPYWNLPNKVFKDTTKLNTMDVNDIHNYLSRMDNSFNYQRYKTILEVKALNQQGGEKILVKGAQEPKLWSRMNAIMGLADLGYELDISEVESALNKERSTLISGFFKRYASRENVTEGELYILRQSIKITDQDARFNILKTLSRWDNNLADLYFVAASYDPSDKIKRYANKTLKTRNLDSDTLELYRNIIIGNTEVDFMIESEDGENISENTTNDSSNFNG